MKNSWDKVLTIVPEVASVDDVPPAPSVIFLPAPPTEISGTRMVLPDVVDPEQLIADARAKDRQKWQPAPVRKRARQSSVLSPLYPFLHL